MGAGPLPPPAPHLVRTHVFTEALSVLPAGEVEVAVQVEVVGGQLRHPHDGLLALVPDDVHARLLLRLAD